MRSTRLLFGRSIRYRVFGKYWGILPWIVYYISKRSSENVLLFRIGKYFTNTLYYYLCKAQEEIIIIKMPLIL